jgi:16S rRNA G966 N2-methylase RsmD
VKAKKKFGEEAGLKLVKTSTAVKTKVYNNIDLNNWKDYSHIETGTLWMFPARVKNNGHKFEYHGNYIPQIAEQLYTRYTKPGDIVLDLFMGAGTSGIEALNMNRRCIGVELKQDLAEKVEQRIIELGGKDKVKIICADSASPEAKKEVLKKINDMGNEKAQFLVLHPPYADIIKFSEKSEDLSNSGSIDEFLDKFYLVAKNGYDCLEKGRYATLIIGDKYSKGELVPLSFLCMQKMNQVCFKTKSIIVKNIEGNEIGKGRTNNLWRYRALAGGFYIFKHEYIMVFEKK